ncbi:hypothetical protein D9615_001211 [Tricholomella constricta]|uniref:Uncharacterized protein n=1 Tax=Tricholomella constricta TaxID=117010 RepID=A0A8H5HL43_9AGAR|nr:hypothetical protein D9615_001211 [Tricholomella constricta]
MYLYRGAMYIALIGEALASQTYQTFAVFESTVAGIPLLDRDFPEIPAFRCYMLIAMTFHFGLILVMVTTLTIAQSVLELFDSSGGSRNDQERLSHSADSEQPLLERRSVVTRPRSRSKPDDIFIHPTHSNLARADALASEMGISGNTDRVQVNKYEREEAAWNAGEGKEAARALLGSSRKATEHPFHISTDSDSDSD